MPSRRRRRRPPPDAPYTNLAELPLVCKIREMARLYRYSVTTIARHCRAGTFWPRPTGTNPYTWHKADVLRDLEQPRLDVRPPSRRRTLH